MTIAVALKVHDGVVLATDSASTLTGSQPDGSQSVLNVYNNANKIANLLKGSPVGIMTWGNGAIGSVSAATIFKDLRTILAGDLPGPDGSDWTVSPTQLDIKAIAERVKAYVYDALYLPTIGVHPGAPEMGLLVAGYSAGGTHAELYQIDIAAGGTCSGIREVHPADECGVTIGGQPQAIIRLVNGFDPQLPDVLVNALGVPQEQVGQAVQIIQQALQVPLIMPAMPFQDAIDLAEFFVDTTIKMSRFMPGPGTVGGPIEVAGITKHEGFKWVARKHYYDGRINPQ